ncbi:MAG: YggT family protein [Thermodesulfobacteriota bacterium]
MFIVGNILSAIAQVLDMLLSLYMWIIIARAVLSWVNPDPYNPIVRFINQATEPVLYQVRRYLPSFGGIDFSPLIVLFFIVFLKTAIVSSLFQLSQRLR